MKEGVKEKLGVKFLSSCEDALLFSTSAIAVNHRSISLTAIDIQAVISLARVTSNGSNTKLLIVKAERSNTTDSHAGTEDESRRYAA